MLNGQWNTFVGANRPFCLFPILIQGTPKEALSIMPLDELPIISCAKFRHL